MLGLLLPLPIHVEIAHAGVARALLGLLHREPSLNEHGLENKTPDTEFLQSAKTEHIEQYR